MASNFGGNYAYSTVLAFTIPGFGRTYANNLEFDPGFSGGDLPTGLDAAWHPNSTYFALSTNSYVPLQITHNVVQGDSSHGYSHDPRKFPIHISCHRRS